MITPNTTSPRVCLFGASPDTGNQGVTALCDSTLAALAQHQIDRVTLFDHGVGWRKDSWSLGEARLELRRHGAVNSKRWCRPESYWNLRTSVKFGRSANHGAAAIANADAILDLSAGDSFTDLYGKSRWHSIVYPKLLALDASRPLILLPQTYGPYRSGRVEAIARKIVSRAELAFARDGRSFETLRSILGSDFCPQRHRQGVDMAFALPPATPKLLDPQIASWLDRGDERRPPLAGFNLSGLIYNRPHQSARQFGLADDYRDTVTTFLKWLLETSDVRVVLVPHVLTPKGHPESDRDASRDVVQILGQKYRDRIAIVEQDYSPSELKWLIGQTDWFCGTRMHSTIAGLSSGVPTVNLAYSLKSLGVFESVQLGDQVIELRKMGRRQILERLKRSWEGRDEIAVRLQASLPQTLRMASEQAELVAETIRRVASCKP